MAFQRQIAIVCICAIFLSFAIGCGNGDTVTEPEPEKQEINWINESFTVGPGYHLYYYRDLQQGDTLDIQITLLQGDFIAAVLIADENNYNKWKNNESFTAVFYRTNTTGGNFTAVIPSNNTYYFVVYNSALIVTIEVAAQIKIIRWS